MQNTITSLFYLITKIFSIVPIITNITSYYMLSCDLGVMYIFDIFISFVLTITWDTMYR